MNTRAFKGILFIGDPHVSSKRIGRRKDDYLQSVLKKLEHCAHLCTQHTLLPVVLGDLFHKNNDNSLVMLNRLTRVLKEFPVAPIVLGGNHDKEQSKVSENDAIELLSLNDRIELVDRCAEVGQFEIAGAPVRLWACPHGSEIPDELPYFEGTTVMVTHHDLAFGSSYIGSKPLKPIDGCDFVVNGHMHDTKPAVRVDSTWWHNPGNIEPLSLDLAAHIPMAWEWAPAQGASALTGRELPHGTDLFDLTGVQVAAAEAGSAVAAMPAASQFARLLKAQGESEALKTDDASVLADDLNEVLEVAAVSDASKSLMRKLMQALSHQTPLESATEQA